jgi:hypothetical protein
MAQLYFHCSSAERVVPDRLGSELDDLSEAHDRAVAMVTRIIATPDPEDWRAWTMLVLDENDEAVFEIPFSSVIGRPH